MQGPPPNVYVCRDCFVPCIQIIPVSQHLDRDSTPSQVCNLIPCASAHWQKWDRDTASATDLLMLAETLQGLSSHLVAEVRRDVAAAEKMGGPLRTAAEREEGAHPCDGCDWWTGRFCECPPARPCPQEESP